MVRQKVVSTYQEKYGQKPMLVFSPGRLNIIGEHTDYNDGFVFPAAIDKGIYAAFGFSKEGQCTAEAIDMNESFTFSLESIKPLEKAGWHNYILGVIHGIQEKGKMIAPFNLVFGGDIPEGAGLSSSAALENAIVFGLNELFGLKLSKEEMIFISQNAEHEFVGVKCGIMDQYASMFGQKNTALLLDCRDISSRPFHIDFDAYQILLINTNVKHSLSDSAYNKRREVCEKVSKLLKVNALRDADSIKLEAISNQINSEEFQMALYVIQENERVQKAGQAMAANDIHGLGKLIYASHHGLQNQYKVSCEELNFLVDLAKACPNIAGSRMMGGGFGGCTINIIKKEAVASYSKSVSEAYLQQFGKSCSIYDIALSDGTHLLTDN
ncbi:galactokinase [Lutimonas halocynthiae]|uniref:galactokinase n=1 Tax=Lutimonas halocynthiae TaxID=1446477 RepID=UPI0025B49014|nr:galactokinase [Lutimonas halocynthiae]MDN3643586.1 galactokinase [Lutimonas halocynthiae]